MNTNQETPDTRTATRECALQLIGGGVWPTAPKIREQIGFGSMGTIQDELKLWQKEFLIQAAASVNSAPAHWSPARIQATERFFAEARAIERAEFDAERAQLNTEMAGMKQLVTEAKTAREEAQRWASTEAQSRIATEQQCRLLEDALAHEREELSIRRDEIGQLHQDQEELRQSLARETEAARQREAELRQEQALALEKTAHQHEQALAAVKQEAERREAIAYERLEGLRVQLVEETDRQRREIAASNEALARELAEAKQSHTRFEQENRLRLAAADRQAAESAGEVRALEKMLAQAREDLARLREELARRPPVEEVPAPAPTNTEREAAVLMAAKATASRLMADGLSDFDILAQLQDEHDLTLEEAREILKRQD